jgi:hypothetical protein
MPDRRLSTPHWGTGGNHPVDWLLAIGGAISLLLFYGTILGLLGWGIYRIFA